MGFDPASLGMITLAATSAAAGAASASAQKKSAEATRQAADANAATLRNEADLQKQTGVENAKRMQQDATRQMGDAAWTPPVLPAPGWFRAGQGTGPGDAPANPDSG